MVCEYRHCQPSEYGALTAQFDNVVCFKTLARISSMFDVLILTTHCLENRICSTPSKSCRAGACHRNNIYKLDNQPILIQKQTSRIFCVFALISIPKHRPRLSLSCRSAPQRDCVQNFLDGSLFLKKKMKKKKKKKKGRKTGTSKNDPLKASPLIHFHNIKEKSLNVVSCQKENAEHSEHKD